MIPNRLLPHRLTFHRLNDAEPQEYAAVGSAVRAMIQPMDAENAAAHGMAHDRSFDAWVRIDVDCEIGDKAQDQDGRWYQVSGKELLNYGRQQHIALRLSRQLDQ